MVNTTEIYVQVPEQINNEVLYGEGAVSLKRWAHEYMARWYYTISTLEPQRCAET